MMITPELPANDPSPLDESDGVVEESFDSEIEAPAFESDDGGEEGEAAVVESDGEEEEEEEGWEEFESSSEDEDVMRYQMKFSALSPPSVTFDALPSPMAEAEDEEFGAHDDDDDDSPVDVDTSIVQFNASNVMPCPEEATKPATYIPKPTPATTSVGAPTKKKRKAATKQANSRSKKSKMNEAEEQNEEKKLFARIFSEEDEIVMLKGMLDFSTKTQMNPFVRITEFHNFIDKMIGGDKTKRQLIHKMRRLKKRYDNHAEKMLKSGKGRILSNPHEQNLYDLSKLIWGNEENDIKMTAKGSEKISGANSRIEEKCYSFFPNDGICNTDWFLQVGKELMEEEDSVEMETKWKEFKLLECELLLKKQNLLAEHLEKVLKGLKSYGN